MTTTLPENDAPTKERVDTYESLVSELREIADRLRRLGHDYHGQRLGTDVRTLVKTNEGNRRASRKRNDDYSGPHHDIATCALAMQLMQADITILGKHDNGQCGLIDSGIRWDVIGMLGWNGFQDGSSRMPSDLPEIRSLDQLRGHAQFTFRKRARGFKVDEETLHTQPGNWEVFGDIPFSILCHICGAKESQRLIEGNGIKCVSDLQTRQGGIPVYTHFHVSPESLQYLVGALYAHRIIV